MQGFRPIYYPDTFELDRSQQFIVQPGQEVSDVNFVAHFAEVLRVRGRIVSGLTNGPVGGGSLAIESLDVGMRENKKTGYGIGEDGRFEVSNLTPGRYLISALIWDLRDRKDWHGNQEMELKTSNLSVLLRVFPGHDVLGRIEPQDGNKIDMHSLQVQLKSHTDVSYGSAFANVNADGTFFMPGVGQDVYDVGVSGLPSPYYLQAAMLGDVDVTGGQLRIGDANELALLTLRIRKSAAELTGKVQTADGKRACSAEVVLIPDIRERAPVFRYAEALADQLGNYSLKGVMPGNYRLFAWDQSSPVPYLEPGALERYESQGYAIHVNEGDRLTVPLRLIPTEPVTP
jgi:hypothetical protein